VNSTNDRLRELAEAGAPEGATVVAGSQRCGRGRQGRTWVSTPGLGLYLSVLLRPHLPARDAGWLALVGGVGVARALEATGLPAARVKWPNDVYAGGRKIAGVLVEPRLRRGRIEFAVLGLGVNVGQGVGDFPEALRDRATSLKMEGITAAVDTVGRAVLAAVETCYGQVNEGRQARTRLFAEWKERGGLDLLPEIT
jgi:BirA family biotin operon repressor/biotin-[acetyl-CoA-carboxylase] ligase